MAGEGDARKVVELYGLRWRIEDWHRILKTGCKVETLAHRMRVRVERALAINAMIAWRIAALTHLGRMHPELPPEVAFSEVELALLTDVARSRNQQPLSDLGGALRLVASLGGHLNRATEPPPGHETAWLVGLSRGLGERSELGAKMERA